MKKRCISMLMALAMVFSMLPATAFAADGTADPSVSITYTYSSGSDLVVAPETLEVSAGEAASYGIGTATEEPTVLDAVAAAHAHELGEAFTADTAGDFMNESLSLIFGESGFAGHIINGHYSADMASAAVLNEGDIVDTLLYDPVTYGDYYTRFFGADGSLTETTVSAGDALELTTKGFNIMMAYEGETWSPMPGLKVGVLENGVFADKNIATAQDGSFSITFDTPGTYLLTTSGPSGSNPVVPAWCTVTVNAALSPEEQAGFIAADAAALTVPERTEADLPLPNRGASGKTAISWTSSQPNVISDKGIVTRQVTDTTVTLTATVSCGSAESAERTFSVTVPALSAENITAQLNAAKSALLQVGAMNPVEYSGGEGGSYAYESEAIDRNIVEKAAAVIRDAAPVVRVSLSDSFAGNDFIRSDGTIVYPEGYTAGKVNDLPLVLSLGEESLEVSVSGITVPTHDTTKAEAIAEKLASLTDEKVLNKQSADSVTGSLYLDPGSTYGLALTWTSDSEALVIKTGTSSKTGQLHEIIRPAFGQSDAVVHLTAAADYTSMAQQFGMCDAGPMPAAEDCTKTFTLTVPAYTEEEWTALKAEAESALDGIVIKPFGQHGASDPAADLTQVDADLMLPNVSGFKTVWTSKHPNIAAPAYETGRAAVSRPVLKDSAGTVTVTLTKGSCTVSRDYTVTVSAKSAETFANAVVGRLMKDGIGSDWNTPWFVADLGAWELLNPGQDAIPAAAEQAYIASAIQSVSEKNTDAATLSKTIISLKALGVDASQLYLADGTHLDTPALLCALVDDAAAQEKNISAYSIYTLPYVLIALQQDESYATSEQIDKLVASALAQNVGESSWGYDGIPPVALALAPYYNTNADVKAALDRVTSVEYLARYQGSSGAIEAYGSPNPNSTGLAVMGLTALGKDPADYVKDSKSLLEGLLSMTNEAGDWFLYNGSENAAATEQALRGLLGVVGSEANNGAYRLYDFSRNASNPARESWDNAPVFFSVIPGDAAITLTDSAEAAVPAIGTGIYDLAAGTYKYSISKNGYQTKTGSLTISADDAASHLSQRVNVSLSKEQSGSSTSQIRVTVDVKIHDADVCGNHFTYKHNADQYTSLVRTTVSLDRGSTVFDALDAALTAEGISYVEISPGYIGTINGLSEFDHGSYSGWMYRVGSTTADVTSREYVLNSSATVTWFYTDDYRSEYGSEGFGGGDVPVQPDKHQFTDVPSNAWYAKDVETVVSRGWMKGVSDTRFAPDTEMSRAMLVTVLYRMNNRLASPADQNFGDVADDMWYTDAVNWAAENNIVEGYGDGTFGTNDPVTREQIAVILYRYAQFKELDVSERTDLSAYPDHASVSPWAVSALEWACGAKLMRGMGDGTLAPQNKADRAQVSALLVRFSEETAA